MILPPYFLTNYYTKLLLFCQFFVLHVYSAPEKDGFLSILKGRSEELRFRVERGSRRVSAKRRFHRVVKVATVRQAGATVFPLLGHSQFLLYLYMLLVYL